MPSVSTYPAMRRNFLSWKRGLQLNYNITRLEEWCKSHELPDGADCLKHLIQTSKLLQLRKYTIEDINILRSICSDLSPAQLQKLITQSHVADYESPIPDEILKYVADLVKSESLKTREGENGGVTVQSTSSCMSPMDHLRIHSYRYLLESLIKWRPTFQSG